MSFNSVQFLVFFPATVLIYFLTPRNWRWIPLLLGSAAFYFIGLFYAGIPYYFLLLCFSLVVDYIAGLGMAASAGARRQAIFWAALLANFGVLFVYKYFNFFAANLSAAFAAAGLESSAAMLVLILPIGISFHTFQSASYLIDVYRGHQQAETRFSRLALYILFFPQLVAGPIERAQNLLPQIQKASSFSATEMREGLKLMIWGFFKKMVVADRLAMYVDRVFGAHGAADAGPLEFSGFPLLVASYFFAFQLYCDFSGYTDIAIGAARCMGVRLMQNFRTPYFSASLAGFWRRWHISLSGWFRDYVYLPLGGSRVSSARIYFNLAAVFLLSGLWHGAAWTFVIWGALHAAVICLERLAEQILGRISPPALARWRRTESGAPQGSMVERIAIRLVRILRVLLVFHVAMIGFVFFRARSVAEGWYILTNALVPARFDLLAFFQEEMLRLSGALLIVLLVVQELLRDSEWFQRRLPQLRGVGLGYLYYAALCAVILLAGVFGGSSFVYFQF